LQEKIYPILDIDFLKKQNTNYQDILSIWNQNPDIISFFQLRAKNLSFTAYKKLYKKIKECTHLEIIVNDYWKLALDEKILGIHLGKEDWLGLKKSEQKKIKELDLVYKGTSSHSLSDLLSLDREVWNYTGFGPLYSTTSKKTEYPVLGITELKKALHLNLIHLVPIGGIDLIRYKKIRQLGNLTPAMIGEVNDKKKLLKLLDFIRLNSSLNPSNEESR
jgi:thiamine-phosphate pyrophosphorylase